MLRPIEVEEVVLGLRINALGFVFGGLVFLFLGFTSLQMYAGGYLFSGSLFLFLGIPLGIIAIEFNKLRPWTYHIVKLLISGPIGLRGVSSLKEKITKPEVIRAFGLASDAERDPQNEEDS